MKESGENRSYDLENLVAFIGDDEKAIRNMIDIFLNNTPELVERIVKGRSNADYADMAKAAHMLKPTLDVFGVAKLHHPVRQLEALAKSNEGGKQMNDLITIIEDTLSVVYDELRNDHKLD